MRRALIACPPIHISAGGDDRVGAACRCATENWPDTQPPFLVGDFDTLYFGSFVIEFSDSALRSPFGAIQGPKTPRSRTDSD